MVSPRNTIQHAVLIEVYYAFSLVSNDDFDYLIFKLSGVPITPTPWFVSPRNTSQHAVLIEVNYAFLLVLNDDFDHLMFKLSRVPIYH